MILHAATVAAVLLFQSPPANTPPPPGRQQTPASAATAARAGGIDFVVTSQTGLVLPAAAVRVDGATVRQGATNESGHLLLVNMAPGTYRCRIEHEGFLTLEKEVVVKAGVTTTADGVLSAAPAAPRPSGPAAPVLAPGSPLVTLLTDALEPLMKTTDPIAEKALGCSGAAASRLVKVRDALQSSGRADADEMVYVIGGEGSIALNGGKEQAVEAGSFVVVPRGVTMTLTRRGKYAMALLSIVAGPACKAAAGSK